jgi:transcription initiation factor TFIIIB Brf1 subunit/transcription initiation factor TFIIB
MKCPQCGSQKVYTEKETTDRVCKKCRMCANQWCIIKDKESK